MRLINKSVIVTGGANGIGRTYVDHLAREGARVVIADVDGEGAERTAEELNASARRPRAVAARVDVTSPEDVARMCELALEHFGRVDVLLNNAGSYPHVAFEEIGYEDWQRVLRVNLDSVFLCCQSVLPAMKAGGGGKIINVATNLVWVGLAGMVHYIAAKAGVIGFTRALAREVGEHGITVNALAPGAVIPETRLSPESRRRVALIVENQCVQRPQRPEDLVGTLLYLASDDSNFVSGQVFTVDGGLTTH